MYREDRKAFEHHKQILFDILNEFEHCMNITPTKGIDFDKIDPNKIYPPNKFQAKHFPKP